jgi:hypothetical protein
MHNLAELFLSPLGSFPSVVFANFINWINNIPLSRFRLRVPEYSSCNWSRSKMIRVSTTSTDAARRSRRQVAHVKVAARRDSAFAWSSIRPRSTPHRRARSDQQLRPSSARTHSDSRRRQRGISRKTTYQLIQLDFLSNLRGRWVLLLFFYYPTVVHHSPFIVHILSEPSLIIIIVSPRASEKLIPKRLPLPCLS